LTKKIGNPVETSLTTSPVIDDFSRNFPLVIHRHVIYEGVVRTISGSA
jgi:hypothetical protein